MSDFQNNLMNDVAKALAINVNERMLAPGLAKTVDNLNITISGLELQLEMEKDKANDYIKISSVLGVISFLLLVILLIKW